MESVFDLDLLFFGKCACAKKTEISVRWRHKKTLFRDLAEPFPQDLDKDALVPTVMQGR